MTLSQSRAFEFIYGHWTVHNRKNRSQIRQIFLDKMGETGVSEVSPDEIPERIAALLSERGSSSVAIATDFPLPWLAGTAAGVYRDGPALTTDQLDAIDATISGCAVAIAETGTIVLDSGPTQGRRALSLVPDHLIVIIREDQVVEIIPEAIARLRPDAAQTWISGPSATSDIEFERVEGVRGPRTLDVVLVR